MARVRALREFPYASVTYQAGQEFDIADGELIICKAIGAVEDAPTQATKYEPPKEQPEQPSKVATAIETLTTRDMRADDNNKPAKGRYPRRDMRAKD